MTTDRCPGHDLVQATEPARVGEAGAADEVKVKDEDKHCLFMELMDH